MSHQNPAHIPYYSSSLQRFVSIHSQAKLFICNKFNILKLDLVKTLIKILIWRPRIRCDEIFTLLLEVESVINCLPFAYQYFSDNKDENFINIYQLMHGCQPTKNNLYGKILIK